MWLDKYETTVVPNNAQGRKFADNLCERLIAQNAFHSKKEDNEAIHIKAVYHFEIKTKEVE